MPNYPQSATGLNYITYPVGPAVSLLSFNAGSPAHTKGAYTEIIASTPFATNSIRLAITGNVSAIRSWLMDLAIGAAGAEVVAIPNLLSDIANTGSAIGNAGWHNIPIAIPAGTRISVRCQSNTASAPLGVYLTLVAAGDTPGLATTSFVNYGAVTASSRGTQLDPGAVANTKSAYVQITASTTNVIQWMLIGFSHSGGSLAAGISWAIDIATGTAGAEIVLIPDIRIQISNNAPGTIVPRSHVFLTYIPSGTRIAARISADSTATPTRLLDILIIGATAPTESIGGASSVAFIG